MLGIDGRGISFSERELIRLDAIDLWIQGSSPQSIAKVYQTENATVHRWIRQYKAKGLTGLKTKGGLGKARRCRLSKLQLADLKYKLISDKPKKYGYPDIIWTYPSIIRLIEQEYGISYANGSVHRLLERANTTLHKVRSGVP